MLGFKCRKCGEPDFSFEVYGANRGLCPCCCIEVELMQRLDLYPIIKPISGGSGETDKPLSRTMKSYYRHHERNLAKHNLKSYSLGKRCRCGRKITNTATECKSCVKRNPKSKVSV